MLTLLSNPFRLVARYNNISQLFGTSRTYLNIFKLTDNINIKTVNEYAFIF